MISSNAKRLAVDGLTGTETTDELIAKLKAIAKPEPGPYYLEAHKLPLRVAIVATNDGFAVSEWEMV